MTISERLLKLRKERNLSQEELANVLDVSRQTISKWETGESTPDFNKIIPLCEFYGITSDELLSGSKDIIKAKEENKKNNFARNIAIAVSLYILSLVAIILFSTSFNEPIIGVCLFFTIIAGATGLIVFSAIKYKSAQTAEERLIEQKAKEEKSEIDLICSIIGIIGLVTYFIVSFATGAWYITWVIFLIIGLCDTIAKLIYSMKKKPSISKEDKNE